MLLIHPPGARSSEPPLGIARLAGVLRRCGAPVRCLDLSREGQDYLLKLPMGADDTWTCGALRRRERHCALLRTPAGYASRDRYRRAVHDLNHSLKAVSAAYGVEAGLADYRDDRRSPVRRADLLAAAAAWEENCFHPVFAPRITECLAALPARAAVGLSLTYLSQALPAFAVLGYLRRTRPDLQIVLGGGLITSWLGQGRLSPEERFGGLVDGLLPGRGEEAVLRLAGITGGVPAMAPDFEDFRTLAYFAPTRILPYNFSTGCAWRRCSFCPERAEGSAYVSMEPATASGEIAALVAAYQPGLLHFTDSEVAPAHLRRLAEVPPGVNWYGFARFSPLLTDAAFCHRLAASGCRMLQLGLESADQRVLDALGKGIRLGQAERALHHLADAGIAVYLYVLFGTPAEDRDAALRTRDFVATHADRIGFLNVALFNLPAASAEAETLETRPFYDGDLSLYREFTHPRGWNRPAVRAFLAQEVEAEPAIKTILARNPPVFTSSHAPFFVPNRAAAAPVQSATSRIAHTPPGAP